jgi:hypothetical protein
VAIAQLPAFFNFKFTDKDGNLTQDAYLFEDQTFQVLNYMEFAINSTLSTYVQPNIVPNGTSYNPFMFPVVPPAGTLNIIGLNPPSFTTAEINLIAANLAGNPQVPVGAIFMNITLNKLQFLGASGIQTITSA